jgi:hypothetical protein
MIGAAVKTAAMHAALDKLSRELQFTARESAKTAADSAIASAKETIRRTTTRRTGQLEDLWVPTEAGPFGMWVRSYAKHASFIDKGTPPHRIEASRKKVLAFQFAGGLMFRRAVNHPGTKARPFVALATAVGQMAMAASMRAGIDRAAQSF